MSRPTPPDDPSTIDPAPRARRPIEDSGAEVPVLVIAWLDGDPELVGAVLVPDDLPAVFGRGAGDGGEPRLAPIRQVPGANLALPAPSAPWMSRRQLRAQRMPPAPADAGGPAGRGPRLALENLGKRALRTRGPALGGQPPAAFRDASAHAIVGVGDLVAVGDGALFLVATRPRVLPAASSWREPLHGLGDADPLGMVGESAAMWELRDRLAFTARQRGHALVIGPSGSGKERVAQALHRLSPCGHRPLVARNAATIPTALMDVELFGHVANYPNPGMRERLGLIGEADGTTLFLDEIGELPDELQAHLLRVMDSGDYQRLGDSRPRRSELRLVAATNRDPTALKSDLRARFRHTLRVPPLAERREDVPLLMRHILRAAAAEDSSIALRCFTAARGPGGRPVEPRVELELVAALLRHPLPLQVRELEGLLWNAIATTMREPEGTRLHLPAGVAVEDPVGAAPATSPSEVGRDQLAAALERHEGRLERVWRDLGLKNRYVLRRLLEKYDLRGARGDEGEPEE